MVLELAVTALDVCKTLARKKTRVKLTEYEDELYEASARFATTVLIFEDACSQSALLKAERELDELKTAKGRVG